MNFDRLAIHYSWMEVAFAGELMQRSRTRFLDRTRQCRNALLVGEGAGRFLARLLQFNPDIRVTCIEHSAAMIQVIQHRLRGAGTENSRVDFQQMDVLEWPTAPGKYDLVATHFILDCFRAEQLERLVKRLAVSTRPGALWLVTDFREPEKGWRRWRAKALLAMLYLFFKITTGLSASRLTPPDTYLTAAGFKLRERKLENFGFAHSDLWERITE